jgi:hypothetical protein
VVILPTPDFRKLAPAGSPLYAGAAKGLMGPVVTAGVLVASRASQRRRARQGAIDTRRLDGWLFIVPCAEDALHLG